MIERIAKYTKFILTLILFITYFNHVAFAINPLPGNVEPGLVQQNYLPKTLSAPSTASSVSIPQEKPNPLGKAAEKIKFKLNKIILEGNHVYSDKDLQQLYSDKLNKIISIGELLDIAQSITNYYRNNGYILSRAILPPQQVKNGIVRIRILEGYIDQVRIMGNPRGARQILLAYGDQIAKTRPLQLKTLQRYLYLANEIPGTQVKGVLEPSKNKTGASDLNLVVEEQLINLYISYDDYGTRYLGPHQLSGVLGANSIFRSGDLTRFTYLTTTKSKELRYGDIYYMTPLGAHGLELILDGNRSLTHPGFVLQSLNTRGNADIYTISLQYPVIRSPDQNLTVDGGFTYLNSRTTQLAILLYNDRIRPAQIGGTYSFPDRFSGTNIMALHLTHGFNIMDASNDRDSLLSSRFGADGIFTKWNLNASRTQTLFDRFSAYFVAQGQYSYNPLLTSEQFAFGGSQLGRGYDPAEILGDRGLAGSAELRMDIYPQKFWVNSLQMYAFYDAGVIWNIKETPGSPRKQSATSTGMGVRLAMTKFVSGNFMITQPLTKPVAAEELIGRGKCPRMFFSLVASY